MDMTRMARRTTIDRSNETGVKFTYVGQVSDLTVPALSEGQEQPPTNYIVSRADEPA